MSIIIGKNDKTQISLDQVPKNIIMTDFVIPKHRGKHAVEIHGQHVTVQNASILDVYEPLKLDSQAIYIQNTPGDVKILNCHLQAASENLMVGGDTMKIPGIRPTRILIKDCLLDKLLAWKTMTGADGKLSVPVKNILELKDGHEVTIENCHLNTCWPSGQSGYAFMFTPSNGASLRNILVKDCNVHTVSCIVNITGNDAKGINKERTQVTFSGGKYKTDIVTMGGQGWFALLDRGPEYFDVFNASIEIQNAFMMVEGTAPIERIQIENCNFNCGKYGIKIGGSNDGANLAGIVKSLIIKNNTISQASSKFKTNFPENTYV